ncbi:MAG: tetratricopeptide repeat protein [Spirochaetales bacterium]|nr:tetratricopeptide repeat protein [Spirochaetales bacterium]
MNDPWEEGLRLFEEGHFEQALYFLEDIDPLEVPDAAYYQALCYSQLGRADEALRSLDLVIIQESNFLKILQARMIRAFLLTTEKRYPAAEKELKGMIDEGIESVQVFSNYGYVLWASGRGKEGIAWLNRAVTLDPENANAMNSLGYILAEEGVFLERALQLCRKALALKPENPTYLDSLGWIYHRMGQDKVAKFYLEKAVRAQPDNPDFRQHQRAALQALGEESAPKRRS